MPQPFAVHPGNDPGFDAGEWTGAGNIRIPGTVTAGGVVLGGSTGAVTSVTAGDSTVTIGGTATAPTVAVAAATLALKANVASPTFTGTVTYAKATSPSVALTDAATISVDATLGNYFRVTLGGNRTLGNPTGATDGQSIIFEIIQDGTGSRTLALDTKFAFGTGIASFTATTTLNKRDFVGVKYNSTADKFYVIAVAQGY